jgi:integrase/recombinase XerD
MTLWAIGEIAMPRGFKLALSFADWPAEDRAQWDVAFKGGDRFDESGRGTHLASATRQARRASYARFLGFISAVHRDRLTTPPEARIDRDIVAEYVVWRRRSCGDMAIAIDLDNLRGAIKLMCPDTDWSWLLKIIRRIAATAPRKVGKYHLVTSDRLYLLGRELMDRAVVDADAAGRTRMAHAFQYRDGLIIALLALIPLRSRTLAALRIGKHLSKLGDLWALDIPASDTKSGRALDYPISSKMSARIDVFLDQFRGHIPRADKHTSPWASNQGRPMCADAIYNAVRKRTKKAFGFEVNLHRFRHAAASFWSTHDPVNVRGAKDLLGHASFGTTEKYYVMGQSRLAGRALARAVDMVRTRPIGS